MITHIIYHIPGRKVGCTRNLEARRLLYLSREGSIPKIEILEELCDKTDQEAGDQEWRWADRLGYKRGKHYAESGYVVISMETRIRAGRKGGRASAVNSTLEQKQEKGRRAAARRTPEGLRRIAQRCALNGAALIRDHCPHCGLESNRMILLRWHFNKCKQRKIYNFVRGA